MLTVGVSEGLKERIRLRAAADGETMSDWVLKAAKMRLDGQEQRLRGLVTEFRSDAAAASYVLNAWTETAFAEAADRLERILNGEDLPSATEDYLTDGVHPRNGSGT